MNVLLIGSGGREHALAWKLKQSPRVEKLYIAPGNAGTAQVGENVAIGVMEFDKLSDFAQQNGIDFTVVGPDDPLAAGIVDHFKARDLRIWGPTKTAAQIEGSKAFSKQLMRDNSIPTADFAVFASYDEALRYVHDKGAPIVVKASGLALGKGVYVCHSIEEAEAALDEIMLKKAYKGSGDHVVIEEFIEGPEISTHVLSDGTHHVLFPASQDHKPIGEGDTGPNTGGMGTIAPVPWVSAETMLDIEKRVVIPTLAALKKQGAEFRGLLYPGLKLPPGHIKVLEYNARFGDPETQVYMRLLKSDLLDLLESSERGDMIYHINDWESGFAVNIVLASAGYPGEYKKGVPITGIEEAEKDPRVVVFHAGTKMEGEQLVTNGGRVLGVSAIGATLREALDAAYAAADKIHFEGKQLRRDIGAKSL